MHLKRFIIFIVLSSIISLIWSMTNYYHYIRAQLWSSTASNIIQLQPEISTNNGNANNGKQAAIPISPSPTARNVTYLIPPLNTTSGLNLDYLNKSVIFMGMIHNAEPTLPRILQQLNEVTCLFNNTFFFFFESNSNDNTTNILNAWFQNATDCNDNVYKQIIFGDDIVAKDLHLAVKRRSNSTHTHKLSRVEKFVAYRNMLLLRLFDILEFGLHAIVNWDYLFMIDMDVFEIDFVSFLQELSDCPTDIMCINGVDRYDDYRDSFATVEMSHNWIHRPFIFNKSDSYYEKARNVLRKRMPRHNHRYERVRSCFNGLAAYKIGPFLHECKCKYYANDDILLLLNNENGKEDVMDAYIDNEWMHQIRKLINWSNLKGVMIDNDSGPETNLCEHIAFHYCLSAVYNMTLSIAKDTKLYYYPLAPPQTKADRREIRRRKRRATRMQQRQDIFMQHHAQ